MGYMIFLCLSILVLLISWYFRRQEVGTLKRQYDAARAIIEQHATELAIRRGQTTISKGYGIVDDSAWTKEIVFFMTNIVIPKVGPINPVKGNLSAIFLLIDALTADFKSIAPEYFPGIDPVAYEHLVANVLAQFGWTTRTTKGSGDQGVDVVAEMRGVKVVIQCKHYSQPVGNDAVQEAIAGKTFERAQHAAVVSNASFTPLAKQLATTANVFLLHHENLAELEQKIFGTVSVAQNILRTQVSVSPPSYPLGASHIGSAFVGVVMAGIVAGIVASNESPANSAASIPIQDPIAEFSAPSTTPISNDTEPEVGLRGSIKQVSETSSDATDRIDAKAIADTSTEEGVPSPSPPPPQASPEQTLAIRAHGEPFFIHGVQKRCNDITQLDSALSDHYDRYFSGWTRADYDEAIIWSSACAQYGWQSIASSRVSLLQARETSAISQ